MAAFAVSAPGGCGLTAREREAQDASRDPGVRVEAGLGGREMPAIRVRHRHSCVNRLWSRAVSRFSCSLSLNRCCGNDTGRSQSQRSLLRQYGELEKWLASCHTSATETQQRVQLLQSENTFLQDAVQQLCAYSHELVSSQQSLQQELKHLEVMGKVEPAVFG